MTPNRLLRWLLSKVSSRDAATAVVGDLIEELDAARDSDRLRRGKLAKLNLQVIVAIGAVVVSATPTACRSAGLALRDAVRSLRRAPFPTFFIFLILAVALSAATVTFSVVDAVVLKPLPFDRSDRIVVVSGQRPGGPTGLTAAQYDAVRRVNAFESVGVVWSGNAANVTIDGSTESLGVAKATSDAFHVLRLVPVVGRVWSSDDEAHRRDDLAVISERLWRRRFGADPNVVGRVIGFAGRNLAIVGVLPNASTSMGDDRFTQDVWIPSTRQLAFEATRPRGAISPFARLRAGATIDDATREVAAAVAGIPMPDPIADHGWRPLVQRLDHTLIRDARGWLLLLLAAVSLVLLIACVNVANVMLTQSAERARDLAVRASFGRRADNWRRQFSRKDCCYLSRPARSHCSPRPGALTRPRLLCHRPSFFFVSTPSA